MVWVKVKEDLTFAGGLSSVMMIKCPFWDHPQWRRAIHLIPQVSVLWRWFRVVTSLRWRWQPTSWFWLADTRNLIPGKLNACEWKAQRENLVPLPLTLIPYIYCWPNEWGVGFLLHLLFLLLHPGSPLNICRSLWLSNAIIITNLCNTRLLAPS